MTCTQETVGVRLDKDTPSDRVCACTDNDPCDWMSLVAHEPPAPDFQIGAALAGGALGIIVCSALALCVARVISITRKPRP